MNKIPLAVYESLFNSFEFKEVDKNETLNYVAVIEVPKETAKDENKIAGALGQLVTWEIVKRSSKRLKAVVNKEDVFTKTKGTHQVLFINPEDFESIPETFTKFVVDTPSIRKSEGLRLINKGTKVSFKYNRLKVKAIANKENNVYLELQYDFNVEAFHLEHMVI